ncbi:heterokaryon incompatibility protein-domain-containing protein [Rhexocercosporidium sp. MPI-PUGE-AT-0058]|nr:heterokaryon incompatibility protein-domain-containing protein [Rhexocercosporidium sp. MPI-PUGE-AT-0058]
MRLINTQTYNFSEYLGDNIPIYAILSHTWGSEEVTYQDWLSVQHQNPPRWGWVEVPAEISELKSKAGYIKISSACEIARAEGYEWIWADTVCIDKTNSVELSETINMMYEWYRDAIVCYAFLSDVPPATLEECAESGNSFRCSRWFTRGWTLQELLAPAEVIFYSREWTRIGEREELVELLYAITSIPLSSYDRFHRSYTIAQKMSWASKRTTTRIEDMAYCLLGIFGIKMPLLYGEGENAFFRLQEEIMKRSTDQSILAGNMHSKDDTKLFVVGDVQISTYKYLAMSNSPSGFINCSSIERTTKSIDHESAGTLPSVTNRGLTLVLRIVETLESDLVFAVLDCSQKELCNTYRSVDKGKQTSRDVWIPLKPDGNIYYRTSFPATTIFMPRFEDIWYTSKTRSVSIEMFNRGGLFLERKFSRFNVGVTGILLAFPIGKQGYQVHRGWPSLRRSYDETPWSTQNHSPVFELALRRERKDLAHGILMFEPPTIPWFGNRFVGLFFAVQFNHNMQPDMWSTRILEDMDDCSEEVLHARSLRELDRLTQPGHWRLEDRKNKTAVMLSDKSQAGTQKAGLGEPKSAYHILMAQVILKCREEDILPVRTSFAQALPINRLQGLREVKFRLLRVVFLFLLRFIPKTFLYRLDSLIKFLRLLKHFLLRRAFVRFLR